MTYGELHRHSLHLSRLLGRQVIHVGERVGLVASRGPEFAVSFWGLLRAGASVALLSPKWPAKSVEQAVNVAGLQQVIHPDQACDWAADAQAARPVDFACPPINPSIATIVFSSGSTGVPKAIAHGLNAHRASAQGSNENLPVGEGDRWLMALPTYHVSGLGILFRCTFGGATVVAPDPSWTLGQQIELLKPTHVSLVPTQFKRLINEMPDPPSSLKAVLLGGAPWPTELILKAYAAEWPMYTSYGLSEMASQVTTTSQGASTEELQTAGRPLKYRELMISPSGEIKVRGATLFSGYVRCGQVVAAVDRQGWFATGDTGLLDEHGRLRVVGRRDNMLVSGGENIYPEEIERELLSLPEIQQAIVVAVASIEYGERPVAFVASGVWNESQWRQHLLMKLPTFKVPDRFIPWPDVNLTKPDRIALRSLACAPNGPTT